MKIVVQSCTGYEKPLEVFLKSIKANEQPSRFIIVRNKALKEEVHTVEYTVRGVTVPITTIDTPRNLWEYVSYEKIRQYGTHKRIASDLYFFTHDTCWAGNSDKYWAGIKRLETEHGLEDTPNGFCYPFQEFNFNMGVAQKPFIEEFGKQFVGKEFSKREGILLELGKKNIHNIQSIKRGPWPVKHLGPRWVGIVNDTPYSTVTRTLAYIPLLDLYKAYHIIGDPDSKNFLQQQQVHPNRP